MRFQFQSHGRGAHDKTFDIQLSATIEQRIQIFKTTTSNIALTEYLIKTNQLNLAICWPQDFDDLKLISQSRAVLIFSWIIFSISTAPRATLLSHSFRIPSNFSNRFSALENNFVNFEAFLNAKKETKNPF